MIKLGSLPFSDQIEKFYKPKKGRKHILTIVRGLLSQAKESDRTNLDMALDFVKHTLKRHGILIVISDFLDKDYERSLIQLNKKHEIILIRLYHPNELFQMGVGTIPVMDIETHSRRWLNAGDIGYRKLLNENFEGIDRRLKTICKKHDIGYIPINTQEDYFPVLEKFFKKR